MEDIQSLLEKINREGVKKADDEAQRIIKAAEDKADKLIADAKKQAELDKAEADKAAKAYAERAEETIRQAERDTIIRIQDAVTAMLQKLLTENVNKALGDETSAKDLVFSAIKGLSEGGEIAAGEKLANALKAQASSLGNFKVITDAETENGFTVRLDGGRVEHSFTSEVIAAELSKRLRPDLAKLLK